MYAVRYLALLALLALPALPTHARQPAFALEIQPGSGPPGTTVTISGSGLAPNAPVRILAAPFSDPGGCRAVRGSEPVGAATGDAAGNFAATSKAERLAPDQAGITYFFELAEGPLPRPTSDLACFAFTDALPDEPSLFFPETGHVVSGPFLSFWQANGGLAIFGYPLSERRSEGGRAVQYFERARFELPEGEQAADKLLMGRLGVELLALQGVDWQQQPAAPEPAPDCLYFAETRHAICNQERGAGFLQHWVSHGREIDGRPGSNYPESLALFGMPLTEPMSYIDERGETVEVQWFERARFEWRSDNPEPYRVLLGRLGAELLAAAPGNPEEIAARARQDLAGRLGVDAGTISVASITFVRWPSSALGCPDPSKVYLPAVTPGYRVVLEAQGRSYAYHTDSQGQQIILCQNEQPAGE